MVGTLLDGATGNPVWSAISENDNFEEKLRADDMNNKKNL